MTNFNKFALDLSNAKSKAVLKVNGNHYNVKINNITKTSNYGDIDEQIKFEGEVLNTAYDQYGQSTLSDYLKETCGNVIKTTGHSTPYYPYIPVNPTYGITITRNPDLRYLIDKVIFNNPATIIIWKDGTKTVVRCQEGEIFDEEKGLAMAISKRVLGDKGNFNEVFKEYVKNEPEKKTEKEGKWIVEGLIGYMITKCVKCSACDHELLSVDFIDYINEHQYCPHCGAKMTGMEEKK
jgi:hypothetical protein